MCGVVGIVSKEDAAPALYEALTVIQHRGQDAAGIATNEGEKFHVRKQLGLVREVFRQQHIVSLKGKIGIGHVRYPTAGGQNRELAQPMYSNSPFESGKPVGYYSYRNKVWQNTSRGGIMPIAFEKVNFEKYFDHFHF